VKKRIGEQPTDDRPHDKHLEFALIYFERQEAVIDLVRVE
jgi:hypothetical protein